MKTGLIKYALIELCFMLIPCTDCYAFFLSQHWILWSRKGHTFEHLGPQLGKTMGCTCWHHSVLIEHIGYCTPISKQPMKWLQYVICFKQISYTRESFSLRIVLVSFELIFVTKVTIPLLWFGRTYVFVGGDLRSSQTNHILRIKTFCGSDRKFQVLNTV